MAEPRTLLEEVHSLRNRVETLSIENQRLRDLPLNKTVEVMHRFNVTPVKANIIMLLATGKVIRSEEIRLRCCNHGASQHLVKVHVSNLRKLIAPIKICSRSGRGYWLEADDLAALRKRMRSAP